MAERYGSLPFEEQIRFFRQKVSLPTRAWTDIWQAQHDHAFVVAGATRRALLEDVRNAVDQAISDGGTLAEFRKSFDATVERYGWNYKGGRNWRTRVIYDTNLRTSYAAGRLAQMKAVAASRPYWRYRHSDAVEHPRPQHLAWDGLVLAADDPWWKSHYPPNGWGCQCFVETLAERDMQKLGKDGPDEAPPIQWEEKTVGTQGPTPRIVRTPAGIDPGFGYQPGDSWMDAMAPPQLDGELMPSASSAPADLASLPDPRPDSASRMLPADLTEQEYADAFLREFGIGVGERTIHQDVAGEYLVISDALFRDPSGRSKIDKRGRAPYVLLFADAIKNPDEVWQDFADAGGTTNKKIMRRRYVARFSIRGQETPALAVFETGPEGWTGVTAFSPEKMSNLETQARRGVRVYRRD